MIAKTHSLLCILIDGDMPIFSMEDWSRELSRLLETRGVVDFSTFPWCWSISELPTFLHQLKLLG
jgi:hypothetical protein